MIVLVTGFNRSGTSMVTRMLQACGLNLGPEEELEADVAESKPLLALASKTLKAMQEGSHGGGPYDLYLPDEAEQKTRAVIGRGMAEYFEARDIDLPWGWKDPQAGLLLDYWRDGFNKQDFRVVFCMRNPVDCAKSLDAKNNPGGLDLHLALWGIYQRKTLHGLRYVPFVVTHYEDYFRDPEAEFRRVLDFLDHGRWGFGHLGDALAIVDPGKRHFGKD